MFKHRVAPILIPGSLKEKNFVTSDKKSPWELSFPSESEVYKGATILTNFLAPGTVDNLVSLCTPVEFQANQHHSIDPNIVVEDLLLEVLFNEKIYYGRVFVNVDTPTFQELPNGNFGIKSYIEGELPWNVRFTDCGPEWPKVTGMSIHSIPLDIEYVPQTRKLTFTETTVGCVKVVGIILNTTLVESEAV